LWVSGRRGRWWKGEKWDEKSTAASSRPGPNQKRIAVLTVSLALTVVTTLCSAEPPRPGRVWRIGLFHVGLDHVPPSLPALREGLKALGYEEGKNLRLDWRTLPDEKAARETAKEFARDPVDLIVAFESQCARAAKAVTSEIPVVFVDDPVASGLVKSLSHPGGNLTGFVTYPVSLAKQMELFKELVPELQRLLVLLDPQDPETERLLTEVRRAATRLNLVLIERTVTVQSDIEHVFASVTRGAVTGVLIVSPNLQTKFSALILRVASERGLPIESHRKEWVQQGALFSYATDFATLGRAAAAQYIDKILGGAKPATLPVQQASTFELVINLKTAKALGLTIPPSLLGRADQVVR
jgi:putative ABC transport system substrate-binding protein